ncbi:putative AAA+ ATPase domain, P-loop containing nucleoside triphosphate hydrolase [Septoria linicola]|nr:putative AAA+ ATPase domain, P-loop containing nucleoside triphosphate hydrolase [Septoria linicola]
MWRRLAVRTPQCRRYHATRLCRSDSDVIKIEKGSFYRSYPSDTDTPGTNPALFSKLNFRLPKSEGPEGSPQYWSVLSPSSQARTTFLQVLAAQHICIPPGSRTYPLLAEQSKSPQSSIKYVGFDAERGSSVGGTSVRGAYLSARYESRREETDFTVHDYLTGHTELNALEHEQSQAERNILEEVLDRLKLRSLLQMPVANLSNGQTRRARIAKALVSQPEVLLLDGPFMGLDPNTARYMAAVLKELAEKQSPRLIFSLRPEDGVPDWITHLVVANADLEIVAHGPKHDLIKQRPKELQGILSLEGGAASAVSDGQVLSKDGFPETSPALPPGEPLVEMQGVKVAYGDKTVLGDWKKTVNGKEKDGLWWTLHRGQRCGIFGPNGSGKTTMLSLITSDHPQTYSLPIKLFGRSRLPGPGEPGISLFDLQQRMGHSSPEVHSFFPKNLTVRRAIESAWADAPMAKPKLSAEADRRVDAILRWFTKELHPAYAGETLFESIRKAAGSRSYGEPKITSALQAYSEHTCADSDILWAEELRFRDLSFSSQRLTLFLRAIVASPDLVILDEALSGIDETVRDKALLFLSHGENMVLTDDRRDTYIEEERGEEDVNKKTNQITMTAGQPRPSIISRIGKVTFEGLSPEQALLVISHSKEDVPGCLREWICLPEPGEGKLPRTGTLSGPLALNPSAWSEEVWKAED